MIQRHHTTILNSRRTQGDGTAFSPRKRRELLLLRPMWTTYTCSRTIRVPCHLARHLLATQRWPLSQESRRSVHSSALPPSPTTVVKTRHYVSLPHRQAGVTTTPAYTLLQRDIT